MKTKRLMKQLFIFSLIITSLIACSGIQLASEENYKESLNQFIGKPVDDVVDKLGYADQRSEAPNGNRLFIYSTSQMTTSDTICSKDNNGDRICSGGDISIAWCKTYFEVDHQNTVVAYFFKGNSCGICDSKKTFFCF